MKRIFCGAPVMMALCAAFCSLLCAVFSGCSKGSSGSVQFATSADYYGARESAVYEDAEFDPGTDGSGVAQGRKLILTGSVSLEVQSLAQTRDAITRWVSALGGYIESSNEQANSVSFTVRIPADAFDSAMEAAKSFGTLRYRSVSSDDVTDRYYDLATRLETRRLLLSRLEERLSQATEMRDILAVEEKINEVTSELEVMQGQMNRLSSQIDFATINITASLPINQTEDGFRLPDTRNRFREFVGNVAQFFVGFVIVLLYVVVFGVPIALAAILLYWLCFGKIGLLRRLFNRVRAKKK